MVDINDVNTKINELIVVAAKSAKYEAEAGYKEFQTCIETVEGLAREAFQAKLDSMYGSILNKLEEGKSLTAAEHNILELLMVGEAKYYLRYEHEIEHWRNELKEHIEEIKKQQAAGLDEIDGLMRLRAICREALRVLPEIAYYFHEKERVRKFEELTRDAIDTETRRSLANLLKEMIESDSM